MIAKVIAAATEIVPSAVPAVCVVFDAAPVPPLVVACALPRARCAFAALFGLWAPLPWPPVPAAIAVEVVSFVDEPAAVTEIAPVAEVLPWRSAEASYVAEPTASAMPQAFFEPSDSPVAVGLRGSLLVGLYLELARERHRGAGRDLRLRLQVRDRHRSTPHERGPAAGAVLGLAGDRVLRRRLQLQVLGAGEVAFCATSAIVVSFTRLNAIEAPMPVPGPGSVSTTMLCSLPVPGELRLIAVPAVASADDAASLSFFGSLESTIA